MAGSETKGWMSSGMKFGVSDELSPEERPRGPLLPLRLLVVSELVPRGEHNAGASAPDAALRVDPSRFDDLFGKLRPRIAIEVPSVLLEGRPARVDLSPTSLKSFRPDGLLAEVPLLRSLMDARLVLERMRDGSVSTDQAQSELSRLWNGSPFAREVFGLVATSSGQARPAPARAPAPPPPVDTSLDSLLDMVDVGGSSSSSSAAPAQPQAYEPPAPGPAVESAMSKFSSLIAQVASSGKGSGSGGVRPMEAIARIEKAIAIQIGSILQHPEVRRLEQAWRGLKLLCERAQGHSSIRIELVNAAPENAATALARAIRDGAGSEPPVSCAVVDMNVDGTAAGWSRFEALAGTAEAYTVPVVVNGTAKLLGLEDLGAVEKLDNKAGLFTAPHQAPWRAASAKPALRWAAIAINGVLGRLPYDKTTSRVREATIRELPDDAGGFVWIPPAYAIGALIAASFKDTGWPCRIVGARSGGLLGNLPVHELKGGYEGEEGVAIPTEAFISTDSQRELSRSGVLALASAPNSDAVHVLSAPTAYVTPPKKTYDSDSTEPEVRLDKVSLVDQLFVARFVQFLRALCSKLPPSSPPAEVEPVIEGALWALMEDAQPGSVELHVKAHGRSDGTVVEVTVKPRRFLGVQIDEVSLEMPLG